MRPGIVGTIPRKIALSAVGALALATALDGPKRMRERLDSVVGFTKHPFEDPHQTLFVIRHASKPWISGLARSVLDASHGAELSRFGSNGNVDGQGDAYRHAYAAALFTLRSMRDHGMSAPTAIHLTVSAGDAHERDGADNPAGKRSAEMDMLNNELGAKLVGTGQSGITWISESELETRVWDHLIGGSFRYLDADGQLTPTDGEAST